MIWDCDLGMELGKWNTRYCQLSSLHSSPHLKPCIERHFLPSLKIYFFVLFFYDWEISHISCCCCCRFSFLVFTVTLSPSIPPNLSLSETLITMVESNPPRRLNVHQALGGGSGPPSLSLQIYAYIFIFIMHIYTAMYEFTYIIRSSMNPILAFSSIAIIDSLFWSSC